MPGYPRPAPETPRRVSGALRPSSVAPVALADLADLVGAGPLASSVVPQRATVTGVTHASDQVQPGDLYAALPGARRHGAEFTAAAVAAGAVAVLTDAAGAALVRAGSDPATTVPVLVVADPRQVLGVAADAVYGAPTAGLTVIGITGTAGKTSTAYLIESGLRAAGHVTGLIGTVETRLGDLVVKSVRTTPEATDLHALFAAARERGVTAVVMEVSSHALAMGRVGGVRFAAGGWTNFGSDHLDFHADEAEYFEAKARLFDGRCDAEVLNLDDPALRGLIRAETSADGRPATITFSAQGDPAATWRAADVLERDFGQRFTAIGPTGPVAAGVALPGRHNVANALLALSLLVAVGVDPATAAVGIAACPGVPGRLERVVAPGPVIGVVDYAHKTDAIVAALTALRELARVRGGRVICVLGAGGDRDRGKRPQMGAAAARGADLLIVSDDNPRTEDPAEIRAQVLAGAHEVLAAGQVQRPAGAGTPTTDIQGARTGASAGRPRPAEVITVPGRRQAIAEAVRLAGPDDVIALLGKGHEQGQEVGDQVLPFDDRIELAAELSRRFATQVEEPVR